MKCENSNKNCLLNSSKTAWKIHVPHTDVQIETDCLIPDTVSAAAENWGRNSVSKEIWDKPKQCQNWPCSTGKGRKCHSWPCEILGLWFKLYCQRWRTSPRLEGNVGLSVIGILVNTDMMGCGSVTYRSSIQWTAVVSALNLVGHQTCKEQCLTSRHWQPHTGSDQN